MHTQRTTVIEGARAGATLVPHASGDATRARDRTPAVSPGAVRDLLDAAGPLSLRDIAAGLGVPMQRASHIVSWMLDHDCLRQDEWRRHTVRGCADAV